MFRKLYKEGSPDLQPLAGLVNAYEAEHQPDRALALMQEETQRAPDSKGKQALLVATAEAAGKRDMALSELQKMAAQNPSSPDVQIRIGALQQAGGKLPEALQAFARARQLAPDRKGLDATDREPGRTASARSRKPSPITGRLWRKRRRIRLS